MIKRYNQYIKEQLDNHLDLDPFGEEDWDDDNPSILQIAKKTGLPYEQIIELYCWNKQLNSLEGIENLVNLKRIYCQNNQLTNLSGIEKLINLEYLDCHNNILTNLDEIENLDNLKILNCWDNPFSKEYKKYLRECSEKKNISISIY